MPINGGHVVLPRVRIGIAGDPMLRHHACDTKLGRNVFLVPGDVYVGKE